MDRGEQNVEDVSKEGAKERHGAQDRERWKGRERRERGKKGRSGEGRTGERC